MSRETIVARMATQLATVTNPTIKKVVRDPIVPEELAKTAFPAVYIETSDEEITDLSMGDTCRYGIMTVNVIGFVGGNNRDTQRNNLVSAIEAELLSDRQLNGTASYIALTGVESVEVGESAPYASVRMVFTVEHHYTL